MGVTWITPVNISPGTVDAWTDVNISANVPVGTTGVLLHFINSGTTSHKWGCRKNGSTDARELKLLASASHLWASCGVDANRILELYIDNATYDFFYLVGYFDSCAVFNTNATNISLATEDAWTDIDINVNDGAIGAIIEVAKATTTAGIYWNVRKNGSTDNRLGSPLLSHMFAIVGLDANETFEGYVAHLDGDFFLMGYIKSGVTFNTNATDLSITAIDTVTDLTALPAGATGGLFEIYPTWAQFNYLLREKGSLENFYYRDSSYRCGAFVKCDADRLIESKIADAENDFFLSGYTIETSLGKVNIGGVWKDITGIYCNIGEVWKTALSMKSNIGGVWK